MKSARMIAIFKEGNRTDPGNYRPISILPVISKILERIAHMQLMDYCTENSLLSDAQSGFRKSHSTQTSLLRMTERVYSSLNSGHFVGMVALDLKKAFDTVNHEILIDKLDYYGVHGATKLWFKDYLSNRSQYAAINGQLSDSKQIRTGVPQGSILGSLLFIIYVNDIPVCINSSEANMYADDTAFYYSNTKLSEVDSLAVRLEERC